MLISIYRRNSKEEIKVMEEKKIKIVSGDGKNLEISPVYEHINVGEGKKEDKRPKNIIVPDNKKKK